MRLLFVYGHEPSGHASAAEALEERARAMGHQTQRIAVSSDFHPVLGKALAKAYLGVIGVFPGFWDYLYDNPAVIKLVRGARRVYLFFGASRVEEAVRKARPDAIVCTHAAPLGFLVEEKRRGGLSCPLVAVVTDFGIHRYWVSPRADLYFTASEQSAGVLREHGIRAADIRAYGIPIHEAFASPPTRAQARRALGVSLETRVILLSGGTRGLGGIARAAGLLLEKLGSVLILAVCGRNAGLLRALQEAHAGDRRLRALGYQEPARMAALLAACDLLIGKPGGLSSAEAAAMGVPLLALDPIPGQEERNARFLVKHGAALRAAGGASLGRQVKSLLEDRPRLEAMSRSARALGHPDSARRIVAEIVARIDGL